MADYSKLAGTLAGAFQPASAGPTPYTHNREVSPVNQNFFNRQQPPQSSGMSIPNTNIDPGFSNPSFNQAGVQPWTGGSNMSPQAMQGAYTGSQQGAAPQPIQQAPQQPAMGHPNYTGLVQSIRKQDDGGLQGMRPNINAYMRSATYRENHPMPRMIANGIAMGNEGGATPKGLSPRMMNYWKLK
jgi:hypothetical protein